MQADDDVGAAAAAAVGTFCMLTMLNGTPKLEVHAAMVVSTYTHPLTLTHTKTLCVFVCARAYQPARPQGDPNQG